MTKATSVKGVLGALVDTNQYLTLGLELAGVIVPLAKGLVKEIRQIGTGTETVTYQVLIETDSAELDAVHQLATDDLAAINAELIRLGKPLIEAPSAT